MPARSPVSGHRRLMPDVGRAMLWGMGDSGQVRLAWPAAVAFAVCSVIAAACTTPGHVGRTSAAQPGGPGAGAQRSSPASLAGPPVASMGCRRRPGVRPGATAQLTVAVAPASAAGAGHRSYWLHVPRSYSASGRDAAGARVSWRRRDRARDAAHQRPVRRGGPARIPGRLPAGPGARPRPRSSWLGCQRASGPVCRRHRRRALRQRHAHRDSGQLLRRPGPHLGNRVLQRRQHGRLPRVRAGGPDSLPSPRSKGFSSRFRVAATRIIRPRYSTCTSVPIRLLRTRESRPAVRRTTMRWPSRPGCATGRAGTPAAPPRSRPSAGLGMTGEAWTHCPAGVSVAGGVCLLAVTPGSGRSGPQPVTR